MCRRPTLSLLCLSRPTSLRLCSRALREPTRASAIEPAARLCGRATAALGASRSTRTDAADVLRACTLCVWLERGLGRRCGSTRSEALLVLLLLVRVERLAVVRAGEDADATEAAAQLVRVAVGVRVVAQLRFLIGLLVLLAVQTLALALAVGLRLLPGWARGTGCRAGRKDRIFDIWLRDAVGIVVRIVLVLWIWLIITHGRWVALSALLRTARRRCGSALLRLRLLLLLLLLLLLEGR